MKPYFDRIASPAVPFQNPECKIPFDDASVSAIRKRVQLLENEIARRRRMEGDLRVKNAELTEFLESAPIGLHWVDSEGIIVWTNQAELKMLGYSLEEYVGKHIGEFHADAKRASDILCRLARGEKLRSVRSQMRCKDGSLRDVLIDSSVLWRDGQFIHTQCFTRDVTESLRIEEDLLRAHQELNSAATALRRLNAMTSTLWQSRDIESSLDTILKTIVEIQGAHAGLLSLVDFDRCVLYVGASAGFSKTCLKTIACIRPGQGACGIAFSEARRVIVQDVETDPIFAPFVGLAKKVGFRAVHSTPIINRAGRVLGVVSVHFRFPHNPSDQEIQIADLHASQTAEFIDRTRSEKETLRLAAIVESSGDAILGTDLRGEITTWNRAAERIFGYPAEEIVGRPVQELIPRNLWEEESRMLSRIRSGGSVEHYETTRIRKTGSPVDISLTMSLVRDRKGKVVGTSRIERDITDRKRAERAKDQFLASLSHELRTPLTPVLINLALLKKKDLDSSRRKAILQIIERNIATEVRLVDELLDVSRIVHGKFEVRLTDNHIDALLRDFAKNSGAKLKNHRFTLNLRAGDPVVKADPIRLEQVFSNLLDNAVKFTPPGGSIRLAARKEQGAVRISIQDSGCGFEIEPSRLFKPFEQERFDRATAQQGLGLGLAICKGIVEAHGGRIEAESRGRNRGASFSVILPVMPPLLLSRQPG